MSLGVALLLVAAGQEPVVLSGSPMWIAPLPALMTGRYAGSVRIASSDDDLETRQGGWLVVVAECREPGCLEISITDPEGARATERWNVPEPAPSPEMQARALAVWLTTVLRREAQVEWSPQPPPPREPVTVQPIEPLVTPDPSGFVLALSFNLMADLWDRNTMAGGIEARARWHEHSWWWVGGAVGVEATHRVAQTPLPVRRWSVPARLSWGVRSQGEHQLFELGVGPAARVVRLDPRGSQGFERFALGGALEASALARFEDLAVGLSAVTYVWGRRQQFEKDGELVYRDKRFQAWIGLVIAYGW